ncbi:death-inducer obliterator 1 isoform X2 [Eublepharis macularius]|uniref:Death-inducer obliterator 1 n=1 Tax=Eublepharis macularius TaxID=481883 RepID=A0AA97JCS8_EUBMA|nr:death-inducer obliterator 1 isoform X2 [Eublepharis macularius]
MMCDELEILNREIERLLQSSTVEESSLNSESLRPSTSDSWNVVTASGNESQSSLVKAAASSGALMVLESSEWCREDHFASDFPRSASAVGIMLSDCDALRLSGDSSSDLSRITEKIPTISNAVSEVKSGAEEGSLKSVALDTASNMENASFVLDDKGEQSNEDEQKTVKPTSKEFRKTWGFRRTTIAKREGLGDADMDIAEQQPSPQQQSLALRRSGRQPKRTERVEEFLTTVRRRGRKNLPTALEDLSEPTSCHVTDIETASEGSVESLTEIKTTSQKCRSKDSKGQSAQKGRSTKEQEEEEEEEEEDTSDSDSDGLTLKELQNRLRKKRVEQKPTELTLKDLQNRLRKKQPPPNPTDQVDVPVGNQIKAELAVKQEEPEKTDDVQTGDQVAASEEVTEVVQVKKEPPVQSGDEGQTSIKSKTDSEIYDPSTLYCICQQPHNNRFMICCDRCEEWFHGDCVGISEARGRLLERNGEDYICPNCTILQVQDEPVSETQRRETVSGQLTGDGTELTSIGTVEQKSSEDQGIKGRIEKAANPSGKKKLKIFQPVLEEPEAASCIGPGCSNVAQPGSVYCGHECIIKHATATMKLISEGKEQKPKEKTRLKVERSVGLKPPPLAGTKPLPAQKRPAPEKREIAVKKAVGAAFKTEANVQTVAKEPASESSTPSWASDHNYNAVKPERTPAISSSLLFKSQKEERKNEDKPVESSTPSKKIIVSASSVEKQMSSQTRNPPLKKPPAFISTSLTKHPIKYSAAGFKGVIPKKSPLSAGSPASSSISSSKLSPLSYGTSSVPKKTFATTSMSGGSRKPMVSSISPSITSVAQAKSAASAGQSQPNSQIRQNIRRSLKEILWKRVNDSDDLVMTESEVGKIALNIEKEMFNLFQATDTRYKSKYRSIMFNLKDPKNQGLFHRVLREEIALSKLVRMKPEELASKELSVWKEKPARSIMTSRRKSNENKKSTVKQEPIPDVNLEDSPPVSDSDEQQESDRAAPEKSTVPLLDVFSSMLKDTTSQHRAHLFDLNCKICTGQVSASDEESASKKSKFPSSSAKKVEPKPESKTKSESLTQAEDMEIEKEESDNAPEPLTGSATEAIPQPSLEKTYVPLTQGQNSLESPLPNESSLYPASYAGGVITTVTVSGKDPRTAMSTSLASVSAGTSALHPIPAPEKVSLGESKAEISRSVLPPPKSILTKPSSSSDPRYLAVSPSQNVGISETRSPQEGDTSQFLSRISTIWKGFINMQSVAKFVTKAYPVSGSFDYLSEDLPDTIHIGGRISPKTVWDYIGKLKSSVSKELCLIRFHPATEEEEVAYISLYSYFSSRGRFGVVANNNRHVKDLYLIPLSAKDPIPPKLLPFEGPGLELTRPNLILGLVICQKAKRPAAVLESEKTEEKRSRIQLQDETEVPTYSKGTSLSQQDKKSPKFSLYSGDTVASTPPGSPPPPPPIPSLEQSSVVTPSVLKILSSIKTGNSTTATSSNVSLPGSNTSTPSSTAPSSSKSSTPLDHILQTLFGKKKSFDSVNKDSEITQISKTEAQTISEEGLPTVPLLDPIVQQFGQMSKDKAIEEEEDDRPYDPEEEYAPERAFEMQSGESGLEKRCEASEHEDEAYDPEDETILEEAKVTVDDLPNKMFSESKNNSLATSAPFVPDIPASTSLVEQQKMLEELNKQIEEQKRQLEEQEEALRQQRAAVGVSMACFSVSDALLSPPPKSAIAKIELFQNEKQPAEKSELITSLSQTQLLSQGIDPRQSRDPRQARRIIAESNENADSNLKTQTIQTESSTGEILLPSYSGPPQTLLNKDDKTLMSITQPGHNETWVTGEKSSALPEQDVPTIKFENSPQVHQETINKSAGEASITAPVRKVLLPTPPNPCFLSSFSAPNDAQNISWSNVSQGNNTAGVGRDSFSGTVFPPHEKVPGHFEAERGPSSLQYDGQKNPQSCHFFEKVENPAIQSEEERGGPPFSSVGQKGVPSPLICGAPDFHGPRGPPPQFTEGHNPPPNNDGQRGPPPNRFGAPRTPIPSLFSAQHGPPPLFGDNRGPSPSFPGGPQEMAPSQFEEHREPHKEHKDFPDSQYHEMPGPPGKFEGPEPPQFMGNRGPSPFPFGGQRRPPPTQFKSQRGGPPPQFGGPRGPPPNHFGGSRGPPPNQFEGQRGPAPGHMPGSRGLLPPPFEERRGSPPPRFPSQRGPAPHQFGGPRGPAPGLFPDQNEPSSNRHNFQGQAQQGMKPAPRPLLDLPSHPPQHRKEMWDETGPPASHSNTSGQGSDSEGQWSASDFRDGRSNEYRAQNFEGRQRERFEGVNKEKILEQPDVQQSDNRPNRGPDDRRRDRDHNRPWERDRGRNWNRGRERDWERHRERDWDKNRDRNYNKDRERESDRGKDWERNRERGRTREGDFYRRRDRSRSRDRDHDRYREREQFRNREKDRERDRDRDKERIRDRKDRSKSKECDKDSKPEIQTGGQRPSHPEDVPSSSKT